MKPEEESAVYMESLVLMRCALAFFCNSFERWREPERKKSGPRDGFDFPLRWACFHVTSLSLSGLGAAG